MNIKDVTENTVKAISAYCNQEGKQIVQNVGEEVYHYLETSSITELTLQKILTDFKRDPKKPNSEASLRYHLNDFFERNIQFVQKIKEILDTITEKTGDTITSQSIEGDENIVITAEGSVTISKIKKYMPILLLIGFVSCTVVVGMGIVITQIFGGNLPMPYPPDSSGKFGPELPILSPTDEEAASSLESEALPETVITIIPTHTIIPSETFTPTPTNTNTPTPTSTFTPTPTNIPTITFTPINTPTPTYTPTPSSLLLGDWVYIGEPIYIDEYIVYPKSIRFFDDMNYVLRSDVVFNDFQFNADTSGTYTYADSNTIRLHRNDGTTSAIDFTVSGDIVELYDLTEDLIMIYQRTN